MAHEKRGDIRPGETPGVDADGHDEHLTTKAAAAAGRAEMAARFDAAIASPTLVPFRVIPPPAAAK